MRVNTHTHTQKKEEGASLSDTIIKGKRIKQHPSHDAHTRACHVTTSSLKQARPNATVVLELLPCNKMARRNEYSP